MDLLIAVSSVFGVLIGVFRPRKFNHRMSCFLFAFSIGNFIVNPPIQVTDGKKVNQQQRNDEESPVGGVAGSAAKDAGRQEVQIARSDNQRHPIGHVASLPDYSPAMK